MALNDKRIKGNPVGIRNGPAAVRADERFMTPLF